MLVKAAVCLELGLACLHACYKWSYWCHLCPYSFFMLFWYHWKIENISLFPLLNNTFIKRVFCTEGGEGLTENFSRWEGELSLHDLGETELWRSGEKGFLPPPCHNAVCLKKTERFFFFMFFQISLLLVTIFIKTLLLSQAAQPLAQVPAYAKQGHKHVTVYLINPSSSCHCHQEAEMTGDYSVKSPWKRLQSLWIFIGCKSSLMGSEAQWKLTIFKGKRMHLCVCICVWEHTAWPNLYLTYIRSYANASQLRASLRVCAHFLVSISLSMTPIHIYIKAPLSHTGCVKGMLNKCKCH